MKNYKQLLGKLGEEVACDFLIKRGIEIIERRWHFRNKEIDIIARKNKTLIFVEVKTRVATRVEDINELISERKIKFLTEAAEQYFEKFPVYENIRFDVILIIIDKNNNFKISYIENAFNPY